MSYAKPIRRIAIVGTGLIGSGWAAHYLAQGFDVVATDPAPGAEAALRKFVDEAWGLLTRVGLAPGASRGRLQFEPDMRNALRDAKVAPNVVNYVNAHGTSTPIGDTLEAHAIRNFFGEHKLAVSSTKSMTGHLLGGAGGLEAGITVLALRDQILPPTINLENPDPDTAGMDLVPNQARKAELEYAMSNSFGFGGTNGALLFRRWNE